MTVFLAIVFVAATALNFGVLYGLFQYSSNRTKITGSSDLPVIRTKIPYMNLIVLSVLLSAGDVLVLSFMGSK